MKWKRDIRAVAIAIAGWMALSDVQAQPGSLDLSFDPGSHTDGAVLAMVKQSDGKIIIGGDFKVVGNEVRRGIARFESDGSLDAGFAPQFGGPSQDGSPQGTVRALAVQADGKILAGGEFASVNGVSRENIVRLRASGSLDTDFHPIAMTDGYNYSRAIHSVAIQSDGKLIIAGDFGSVNGATRAGVARLNTDGSLDTNFTPIVVSYFEQGPVYSVAIQNDAKVLIGGGFGNVYNPHTSGIARLNTDGSLDDSLQANLELMVIKSLALTGGGKIVVGGFGYGYSQVPTISRLNPDGSLDPTFSASTGGNFGVHRVAVQSDGRVLIGGDFRTVNGIATTNIARLKEDGSLDSSFQAGVTEDFCQDWSFVSSFLLEDDGRILIGGWFTGINGQSRARLARLHANGALDAGFETHGIDHVMDGFDRCEVNSLVCQPDGKVIMGGLFSSAHGEPRNSIARFNADGSLDKTFVPGQPRANDWITRLVLQADGRVLVTGGFVGCGVSTTLHRLHANGSLDTSFNPVIHPYALYIPRVAVQSDGKVLIAGSFTNIGGVARTNFARLNTDGSLDLGFEPRLERAGLSSGPGRVGPVAFRTDGRILIAGEFTSVNETPRTNIAQLNPDGSLDMSFNMGLAGSASRLVVQPDGKILIAGGFTNVNGIARTNLARLNTDGSLDASFVGRMALDLLALQSDGKILGVRGTNIIRLFPDGSVDTTFKVNIEAGRDFPFISALAVQSDDKVLMGGRFVIVNGVARACVARLHGDLSAGWPVVQTLPVTSVTTTSARFNGFVNPNAGSATAYFEFGTTQNYGSKTPNANLDGNSQDLGFVLTGLEPGTTYHCRLVADNGVGTNRGSDVVFTTLPLSTTVTQAWVAGTDGLGLRLRSAPSLGASILLVMPEGSLVTLLGGTQTADGHLWRQVSYAGQEGWAASQYLIFSADGTSPTAPAAPIMLRQLLANGLSTMPAGGKVTEDAVVLAASPDGGNGELFLVQFEVRPVGTGFSAPTHNSRWVRGGSEAQATISGLSNQGYHWRARVLNGNGVASPWVAFSGNATDFVVNAPKRPSAQFSWSPPQVFTDDLVQFTAEAAGQPGLMFLWDFGGGQTATGPAVTRSFAQAETASVTLTVTDAQSNQSQHTETIGVVSKELVERINQLAQLTSVSLDQLLAQAQAVAWATDEFKTGVDTTASKLWLSLVFDAMGAGISLPDYSESLKLTLGEEFIVDTWTELVSEASATVLEKAASGGLYWSIYIPVLQSRINEKKASIEQLRQRAVAAVVALTHSEAEQLARNLEARRSGNTALAAAYEIKSLLPVTLEEVKSALGPAELAANLALSGAIISLTGGAGLIGATPSMLLTVSSSAALAKGTLDKMIILSEQSADIQMFTWSVDVLGQASFFANELIANTENGLTAVRDRQTPATPAGSMTVEHFTRGRVEQFWYGSRWIAETAYAGITVRNTGPTAAKYRMEAVYPVTLTVTKIYGLIPLNYEFTIMRFEDQIQLNPGEERTFHMDYLPDQVLGLKQPINYTLTARTEDGSYLVAGASVPFGTTFLDENGNVIDHSQLQDVLLAGSLAQSTIVQFPGSNFCSLNVNLKNPFSTPLLLQVQQPLPTGTIVIAPTGTFAGNNQLSWDVDLQPNESRLLRAVLKLPVPVSPAPLADTMVSVYDSLHGVWLQFQEPPTVIQVTETPPPQLEASGLAEGGFDMRLWSFIPGVYRVDATKDLNAWQPLLATTNIVGVVSIQDAASPTNALRFYRALRLP